MGYWVRRGCYNKSIINHKTILISYFPRFIDEDENDELIVEISKDELQWWNPSKGTIISLKYYLLKFVKKIKVILLHFRLHKLYFHIFDSMEEFSLSL